MKKKIFIENTSDAFEIQKNIKISYDNKYFNIFMGSLKLPELRMQEQDFILKGFWNKGSMGAFNMKHVNDVGYAPFVPVFYDMYDIASIVNLINKRNVPVIPMGEQVVDKDVAICYILPNHKPVKEMVNYYIDRIVTVEMVINTNLAVHNMPFIVGVSPADKQRAEELLNRILNHEVVVFMDMKDLELVKTLVNSAPYIIDKLYAYKTSLENELLTLLGVDNASVDLSKDRMLVDEVNANNAMINLSQAIMIDNIQQWLDKIEELFGKKITIEPRVKPVESEHNKGLGDVGTYDGNDGGNQDGED